MTSNAGTETIEKLWADPETLPDADGLAEALRPELLKHFKPAFLGRVSVVPYLPLPPQIMREIVGVSLARVRQRARAAYGAELTWTPGVVDSVAARCTESQSGARNIENILGATLVPELSERMLSRMLERRSAAIVRLDVDMNGTFVYDIS